MAAAIPESIRALWQELHGDRRQELVFIGWGGGNRGSNFALCTADDVTRWAARYGLDRNLWLWAAGHLRSADAGGDLHLQPSDNS